MTYYHVYALLDQRKPIKHIYEDLDYIFEYEPFYIGKARNVLARVNNHFAGEDYGSPKNHLINEICLELKDWPRYEIIACVDSEEEAFELEKHYIKILGRKDLKLGPLTNKTNGGEGSSNLSPESFERKRINNSISAKIYFDTLPPGKRRKRVLDMIRTSKEKGTWDRAVERNTIEKLKGGLQRHLEKLMKFKSTFKYIEGYKGGRYHAKYKCRKHGDIEAYPEIVNKSIDNGYTPCRLCNRENYYNRRWGK
jgi:hypothetical protein